MIQAIAWNKSNTLTSNPHLQVDAQVEIQHTQSQTKGQTNIHNKHINNIKHIYFPHLNKTSRQFKKHIQQLANNNIKLSTTMIPQQQTQHIMNTRDVNHACKITLIRACAAVTNMRIGKPIQMLLPHCNNQIDSTTTRFEHTFGVNAAHFVYEHFKLYYSSFLFHGHISHFWHSPKI